MNFLDKFYQFFLLNYEIAAEEHNIFIKNDDPKQYIGDKTEKFCRFCNKNNRKFTKIAHALPEFIGNHSLISYEECNECNEIFSKTIENDFSNYIIPERITSNISGKHYSGRAPLAYKSNTKDVYIINSINTMFLLSNIGSKNVSIDINSKEMKLKYYIPRFKPRNIYKFLLKCALSVMDRDTYNKYSFLIESLKQQKHPLDDQFRDYIQCLIINFPGVNIFSGIHSLLLTSKGINKFLPQNIYILSFGSVQFQIYLPDPRLLGNARIILYPYMNNKPDFIPAHSVSISNIDLYNADPISTCRYVKYSFGPKFSLSKSEASSIITELSNKYPKNNIIEAAKLVVP